MKNEILKVAKDLESGAINEDKAKSLLLSLFGINGSLQPLTIQRMTEITRNSSMETWKAVKGIDEGWKEFWDNRNKQNLNKSKLVE